MRVVAEGGRRRAAPGGGRVTQVEERVVEVAEGAEEEEERGVGCGVIDGGGDVGGEDGASGEGGDV